MPYRPIETRPWDLSDTTQKDPTEEELQANNPMGTDDYTKF